MPMRTFRPTRPTTEAGCCRSRPHLARLVLCPAVAVVVAACGDAAASTSMRCTLPPILPGPSATVGRVTVTASTDFIAVGASVSFSLQVTGPVHVAEACAPPVTLVVLDKADIHVDVPTASAGGTCATDLADGAHATYSIAWTPDVTLPSGVYRAALTVGDQPPVIVDLQLGRRPSETC